MKAKKILIFLLFCLLSVYVCYSQKSEGKCDEPPTQGPPPDNADDNRSFSLTGGVQRYAIASYFDSSPSIGIFKNGNVIAMDDLLKTFGRGCIYIEKDFDPEQALKHVRVLIIPTGGLMNYENSANFKFLLAQFVKNGGTIVCFAQQSNEDYLALPIEVGSSLKAYGWREDQSCYSGSAYTDINHPTLAAWSAWRGLGTIMTDGYFEEYPADSTVILRRTKNRAPLLLYYPYGAGTVILSSLYTDWASAHGQANWVEKALVRDLITFAQNPQKLVPMYSLAENPRPTISLNINIRNDSEQTATKVILTPYSPDRTKALSPTELSINLESSTEIVIPLSIVLGTYVNTDYGIFHVDYELYDAEGKMIQVKESDGGRFSAYLKEETYTPTNPYDVWITSEKENYYCSDKANLTLHVENYTDAPITLFWYIDFWHTGNMSLQNFTVAAKSKGEFPVQIEFPGYLSDYDETRVGVILRYRLTTETTQKSTVKGLFIKGSPTKSVFGINKGGMTGSGVLKAGSPLYFDINTSFNGVIDIGARNIKVSLWSGSGSAIGTVYETTHDFNSNRLFAYTGGYTPSSPLAPGNYRLKLEVYSPENGAETRYVDFYYQQSDVSIRILPIENSIDGNLTANRQYPFHVTLFNNSNFPQPLEKIKCSLLMESEKGEEVYRKEIDNFILNKDQGREIVEMFTFLPQSFGKYYLKVILNDETLNTPKEVTASKVYRFDTRSRVTMNNASYRYLDTASINVEITGIGNYKIKFNSPEAGIQQEKDVQLSETNPKITEIFQVQIGYNRTQNYTVEITGDGGYKETYSQVIPVKPVQLGTHAQFDHENGRAGETVVLRVKINENSGYPAVLPAQLRVYSDADEFNVDTTQNVSIQPMVENVIPIELRVPVNGVGNYLTVKTDLQVDTRVVASSTAVIAIPGASIVIIKPVGIFNAGTELSIGMENTGGKSGQFNIELLLKDTIGKIVYQGQETRVIAAGGTDSIGIAIPSGIKSGDYLLTINTEETGSLKKTQMEYPVQITGISVSLNSSLLKEKYTDNETPTGKSEITYVTGNVENGSMEARIVKPIEDSGIETVYKETDYNVGSFLLDSRQRLWVGMYSKLVMKENGAWTEYTTTPDGSTIGDVAIISEGQGGKIYASMDRQTLIIDGTQMSVEWGGYKYVVVDTEGRLWDANDGEAGSTLRYHGENEEDMYWTFGYLEGIYSDGKGGVWITHSNGLSRVSADFTEQDWPNSSISSGDKIYGSYADKLGNVWMVTQNNRELYSFDGTNFMNYSNFEGYPVRGMIGITGDENGIIYGIGENEDGSDSVYRLDEANGKFIKTSGAFFVDYYSGSRKVSAQSGNVYTRGYRPDGLDGYESGLLKIGSGSGTIAEPEWSETYPVNGTTGESQVVNLNTGKRFAPGNYMLKTRLLSSIGQELATSNDTFTVIKGGADVSSSLLTEGMNEGYVMTGKDIPVTVDVSNNSTEAKNGLFLVVNKISPTGTEENILTNMLNIEPGQTETRSVTFNGTTPGTWRLSAQIYKTDEMLSDSQILIRITEPSVKMEIQTPQAAGDDAYDVTIRLTNETNLETHVTITVKNEGDSASFIEETITLAPQEERILTFTDTLTTKADKNYIFTLNGEVEKTANQTVKYGYAESFNLNALPTYREGSVPIGYTISNTGVMEYMENVHMELNTIGGTTPITTIDRSYNLYPLKPGENPVTETIEIALAPGNYRLTAHTTKNPVDREVLFTVQPSGIGVLALKGSANNTMVYPTGKNEINYTITNSDTVTGNIPVTITITDPQSSTPLYTETRDYYLAAGQNRDDNLIIDLPTKGTYALTMTGSKFAAPVTTVLQVLNPDEVVANVSIGAPGANHIPFTVSVTNTGYNEFTGTAVIESEADGIRQIEKITAPSGATINPTYTLSSLTLTPGTKNLKAYIADAAGNIISQTTGSAVIQGPEIKLIYIPGQLEVNAGEFVAVPLTIKNEGHQRGEAKLKIRAFDNLYQEREIGLDPGEELQLQGITIDAPSDLPGGNYPFYYTLTGKGVQNGTINGNFNFKVNGLTLDVGAAFDRSIYNEGETAQLTLTVTSRTTTDLPLEAVVNWGVYHEKRQFTLDQGNATLTFSVPLDQKRDEKVFYGIYHEGGKGIHLNDIYLNFHDAVDVELDKQVYAPGEIIHAVFGGEKSGTLTVEAFGESQTVEISSSASTTIVIPQDTLGGTYGVNWKLETTGATGETYSGSKLFDVSGLVVKTAKSELEKGKYTPGETINAHYIFESNRDETLELRCWSFTPTGQWTYLGESPVTVTAAKQIDAQTSYTFDTVEAGTHELVYGLYKLTETEDKLVLSARMSFDVGDAVLMGIETDKPDYKDGTENVIVTLHYFGQGTAQMELYLDDQKVNEQSLTLDGIGSANITLNSGTLTGGSHTLKAVLTKDGLTSVKNAGFIYGSSLPDLSIYLSETIKDGLDYTYKLIVSNTGKTASASTTLSFTDNGTAVESKTVSSLQSGQTQEVTINWSGSGKAGTHTLVFESDPSNTVKEYTETDNKLEITEEVPLLVYTLEIQPVILAANTAMTIITRIINNSSSTIPINLEMELSNNETGQVIYRQTKTEELPALVNKTLTDNFNTGVYPSGQYTLKQVIAGVGIEMKKEIEVNIEPTKALTATLTIAPEVVASGVDTTIQLTMNLKNAGNVALDNEPLQIDVYHKEMDSVVKTEETPVTLALSQEKIETKSIQGALADGNYELRLKYRDEEIAKVEFKAAAAIKPEKKVNIKPRVLVMNMNLLVFNQAQLDFISAALNAGRIEYDLGQGILQSYIKWSKGHSNVSVVFGSVMGRVVREELKERVWQGEGLIWIIDNPIQASEMTEFLGVKIKPVGGNSGETRIRMIPGELSGAGEFELLQKNRLAFTEKQNDVVIIGETNQRKHPVIAYRKYGKGEILVLCAPLQLKSGAGAITQLLWNTIARFSKDIYTENPYTRILPIDITLDNKGDVEKKLTVKEIFPYGVEGYDYAPKPDEGDELKWTITVPGNQKKEINYWLKLPDTVNSYDIKTGIYDGEAKLEGASISFEVSQTVISGIDELLTELNSVEATGKDAQNIKKAISSLGNIRSRNCVETNNCVSVMEYYLDMRDSIRTAAYLGDVVGTDVNALRTKAQEIMTVTIRRFYEKVKTEGTTLLNALNLVISGE